MPREHGKDSAAAAAPLSRSESLAAPVAASCDGQLQAVAGSIFRKVESWSTVNSFAL